MIILVYIFLVAVSLLVKYYYNRTSVWTKPKSLEKELQTTKKKQTKPCSCKPMSDLEIQISYFGLGNTSSDLSKELESSLKGYNITRTFIADLNLDEMQFEVLILVVSSYNIETEYDKFIEELEDKSNDFRVGKLNKKYCIIGVGDTDYEEYNYYVKKTEEALKKLNFYKVYCNLLIDVNNKDHKPSIEEWVSGLKIALKVELDCDEKNKDVYDDDYKKEKTVSEITDLEELDIIRKNKKKVLKTTIVKKCFFFTKKQNSQWNISGKRHGYTEPLQIFNKARWTKASMRGRGFCYKKAFYGIKSYLCMETTPSLACANKCVFCWRHHTNPVGTSWKWNMDDPEFVLNGAITNHYKMIKEMRGVPGVINERFDEAFNIKHCALSLVGEPIMYPKISEFVDLLHRRNISTFLVTNAQFPQAIKNLKTVTQLYVSVDASTKSDLKRIDRPLFRDFWERFIDSLRELKNKGQRTGYNVDDIKSYADLVKIGCPDFIEIKGVTYCGYSEDDELTMANVPYHQEIVQFSQRLVDSVNALGQQDTNISYQISCEHAHSCSVLIANTKFRINNEWNTWINYEKFNQLYLSGQKFTSLDYCEKTPSWALFGSDERGFVPTDTRFYRKKK